MNLNLQKMPAFPDVGETISKLKAIATVLLLFVGLAASASHYRYGSINYQFVPGQPNVIDVVVKQAWRGNSFGAFPSVGDSVSISGSGNFVIRNTATNTSILNQGMYMTVTTVNPVENWFFGEWKRRFTLPGPGTYTLEYASCCRIGFPLQNNSNGSFRNETFVVVGSGNNNPVSSQTPIVSLPSNLANASFNIPAVDPDGDPITYRLANSSETVGTSHPDFSITPNGVATFNTVGKALNNLYNVMVVVEDTAGAKTIVDFLIKIGGTSSAPQFDYSITPFDNAVYNILPGDSVKFKVVAFDNDVADVVTINAVGVPVGAVLTPSLPSPGGNPDTIEFYWVPGPGQLGSQVINFTATDNNSVQTNTSVIINVNSKPKFIVPPTPGLGVHVWKTPGDSVKFDVKAYSPTPGDSVTINKIEGKNMMGNKIPIYAGVMFTPFPTLWGDTTDGNFCWPTMASDWGHRHVFFTAEDGVGQTTTHEVSLLLNTVPQFTSTPSICDTVGNLYTYNITTVDPDITYGDSVDLIVVSPAPLPSWMSFVDNGDGTGVLSGTPGPGDEGFYNFIIEAQDINHHVSGIVNQSFTLTIKSDSSVVADTGCVVVDSLNIVSDSSWMMSTVVTPSNLSGVWAGVGGVLPPDGSFTMPATIGQPYPFPSIDPVAGAQVIATRSSITYFQKKFMLSGNDDMAAKVTMTVDDHTEIYINGQLLVGRYTGTSGNFKNPPFQAEFLANGTVANPSGGNDPFSVTTFSSLGDLFVSGMNTITVVVRNYAKSTDRGGFSLNMDISYSYQTGVCDVLDSCVSDSSWSLSTVVTTATSNSYPWPGVGSVPAAGTFTLPVDVGQPYPWTHLYTVPGSEVIKALSGVTYYRKTFELTDNIGVNTRFRMFMDDNVEIFINGKLLAREEGMGPANWRTVNHDILFKGDGTVNNGHMGGDAFDYVAAVDLDTVLKMGVNDIVLAIRNRTSRRDVGGFSFRMDMDKGGQGVIKKSAGAVLVREQNQLLTNVYPNPTTSWVNVVIPNYTSKTTGAIAVLDINGKVLESAPIDNAEVQINLEDYASGIYFIKVNSNGAAHTEKVFKR
jgi:hypothetical protein